MVIMEKICSGKKEDSNSPVCLIWLEVGGTK